MKKIIIFDFDGVLADSIEPMLDNAQKVCAELGHPCIPTQADLEVLEKMEFSRYGLQLGIPPEKIDSFVTRNLELFNTREEPLPIFPGMYDAITQLSFITTLTMITGNSRLVVDRFLKGHQIESKFQKIFTIEDHGSRVEKIFRLKQLYDHPLNEYYLVGDAVSDIQAAKEAEIMSVAVAWGHQSTQKLSREAPDFSVETPEDLLTLFV